MANSMDFLCIGSHLIRASYLFELLGIDDLAEILRRIRKMWREMEAPKDGVWPMEHEYDVISAEVKRRKAESLA